MIRLRILLATVTAAWAQTTQVLDATSGTATISTVYTTGAAGLTLNLGLFVDYLIVGGSGSGVDGYGGGARRLSRTPHRFGTRGSGSV